MKIIDYPIRKSEPRKGETVDLVVIHYTAGNGNALGTASMFKLPGRYASAHYVIGREGEVYQLVHRDRTAWHAGDGGKSRFPLSIDLGGFVHISEVPRMPHKVNRRSIGIELCNRGWAPHDGRPSVLATHRNPGIRSTQWEAFPDAQLQSLHELLAMQVRDLPSLRYICGHEDVTNQYTLGDNPETLTIEKIAGAKSDPGPAFPWPGYPGLVRVQFDFERKGWSA